MLGAVLVTAAIPAALLLGPMIAAIAFGVGGLELRIARPVFVLAQGVVGCLIAGSVDAAVVTDIARDWHVMAFAVIGTLLASTFVGWLMARYGTLPATAVAWGASPGAASAMVLIAAEQGADVRLVALIQYTRVIWVVLAASLISRFLLGATATGSAAAAAHHPAVTAAGLFATLVVIVAGSWLARRFRIPAGGVLVPLMLGALVNATGLVHLATPAWLLAAAYAVLGWYVGLQFERATLSRSARALPEISLAAIAVIALSGAIAWCLTRLGPYDGLTAFLAMSPGGIDSVAIIAVDGGADTPFVMAVQTLRVVVVIVTGPALARLIIRMARPRAGP